MTIKYNNNFYTAEINITFRVAEPALSFSSTYIYYNKHSLFRILLMYWHCNIAYVIVRGYVAVYACLMHL